ncbi:uncharacterized protein [Rutidosis leptorrhynchoides]|uniref:uncharacterized protein isoform X2 n=1 Tax=Rutidosis leptorrhynchoides TaxID=125765 RepID=UPI003A990F44
MVDGIVLFLKALISIYTFLEVYRVSYVELVSMLPSAEDKVNVACFPLFSGGGVVYGTTVHIPLCKDIDWTYKSFAKGKFHKGPVDILPFYEGVEKQIDVKERPSNIKLCDMFENMDNKNTNVKDDNDGQALQPGLNCIEICDNDDIISAKRDTISTSDAGSRVDFKLEKVCQARDHHLHYSSTSVD